MSSQLKGLESRLSHGRLLLVLSLAKASAWCWFWVSLGLGLRCTGLLGCCTYRCWRMGLEAEHPMMKANVFSSMK